MAGENIRHHGREIDGLSFEISSETTMSLEEITQSDGQQEARLKKEKKETTMSKAKCTGLQRAGNPAYPDRVATSEGNTFKGVTRDFLKPNKSLATHEYVGKTPASRRAERLAANGLTENK